MGLEIFFGSDFLTDMITKKKTVRIMSVKFSLYNNYVQIGF